MTGLTLDNPFWKFSVAVYAAPGVADECIAVQDRYDIDVNVLLFCAWLGWSRRVGLTPKDIGAIDAVVRTWHENSVKLLRSVRQFTKGMPEDEVRRLRARVKAIELDAERIEQGMLYAYAERQFPRVGNAAVASLIRSNLEAFLDARGYRRQSPDIAPFKYLHRAIVTLDAER